MDLAARARDISWYHTLELAPGVVTDGEFDLRPWVKRFGLPERIDGMRVLDVGSFDGFWAFEMERRGAAEVVALDLDDEHDLDVPPRRRSEYSGSRLSGDGFALAKEAFGSGAQRVTRSVYDAHPEELGTFDLVFCGMVLIHLRDQMLALERIARLCHGTFISAEAVNALASLFPLPVAAYRADRAKAVVFWEPSARTWRRMMWTAGFDQVRRHASFTMPSRRGYKVRHVVHHASASVTAGQQDSRRERHGVGCHAYHPPRCFPA